MAINNKPSVPAPAIFSSDPLEQIAMRGVADKNMSGLMYMFLNAFGDRRKMDQDAYMAGVDRANQQSMELGRAELAQAQHEAMLKAAVDLVKEGADAGAMPHTNALFGGARGSTMKPELMKSQIAKNYAEGAAASGKGGDQIKVKADVGPSGTGFYSVEGKGPNALDLVRQREIELLKMQGLPTDRRAPMTDAEAMRKYRSQ